MTAIQLTDAELATVLAALRYWQREGLWSEGHEHVIASNDGEVTPLDADAIDDLCERINQAEVDQS